MFHRTSNSLKYLHASLKFANRVGLCSYFNVDNIVHIPKTHKILEVLTVSEQKILESYIERNHNSIAIGIYLSLYAGLRIGEVCGLKWKILIFPKKLSI